MMKFFVMMLTGMLCGLLSAFVGAKLWAWFVVTAFHLPALSTMQFWGLSLLRGMVSFKPDTTTEKNDDDELTRRAFSGQFQWVVIALISWGIGALVHHWAS